MDELKKQFGEYLLYEMDIFMGDHSSAGTEMQVYRFENGFGIMVLCLMDISDGGSWLMRFSFKLLDSNGNPFENIKSKELAEKIQNRYYNTYYFYDNDRLIEAVIELVSEVREYLLNCDICIR